MNLLLINGGKAFGHSQGKLNHSLHTLAQQTLASLGHRTQETVIENGYDAQAEVEKNPMGRCRDLANARMVDGRAVDS